MDMLNPYCGVSRDGRGVARLTICNAGTLNILGSSAIAGIKEGLQSLAADESIRVLLFAEAFITRLAELCDAVRTFPAPVIARLPGWCLGGGLEVAAACDLRVAAHDAKFGMPEVRVGIPSVIHAALLPRLIGWGRTRWLLLTAETVDAPTALAWGLVDAVALAGELDAAVEKAVASLLACGPHALRAQKALLRQWEDLPLKDAIELSVGTFGRAFLTDEPKRLMQGFIDRKR